MLSPNEQTTPTQKSTENGHQQDEITRKKIEKHLTDINDTISEDDIKNVNTNIHSEDPQTPAEKAYSEDTVESETERKEIPTPWKVIND